MASARASRSKLAGGGLVSAVLLAAGLSRRFGRTKQLADLGGVALVKRAEATLARSSVGEVVVVVGHRSSQVVSALRGTSARVVVNEHYRTGLGSSLKTGILALSDESRTAVICLADQPFVTVELIDRIVSRHLETGAEVVASASGELISPPVLFSRSIFGELTCIPGDRGAKAIIERHPDYEKVRVKRGTLLDVDTEQDLERASRMLTPDAIRGRARPAGRP